ncbi:MAG: hypothetical protein M0Z46_21785 [Actinomycetota bacterium]|nr:hypothetical protein [Actinomycetota bacterium]
MLPHEDALTARAVPGGVDEADAAGENRVAIEEVELTASPGRHMVFSRPQVVIASPVQREGRNGIGELGPLDEDRDSRIEGIEVTGMVPVEVCENDTVEGFGSLLQ